MTASEQRLALALGVVLIGGGAFIGLTKLKSWKLRVDAQASEIGTRLAVTSGFLGAPPFLAGRKTADLHQGR
jgi:hypothetical protein